MIALRPAAAEGDRRRFARFLAVGLLNTAVGYGIYAALVLAGVMPQPALAVAFALGVLWNYAAHARFVFGTTGYRKLPAYAAVYVALYALNAFALHRAIGAGVSPLLAQALLAVAMAGISFFALSIVLTGQRPGASPRRRG